MAQDRTGFPIHEGSYIRADSLLGNIYGWVIKVDDEVVTFREKKRGTTRHSFISRVTVLKPTKDSNRKKLLVDAASVKPSKRRGL